MIDSTDCGEFYSKPAWKICLRVIHIYGYIPSVKTTIELPDQLLERVKITAAKQQTTMRKLIIRGLETILDAEAPSDSASSQLALKRLQQGYALGNQPLSRDQTHDR